MTKKETASKLKALEVFVNRNVVMESETVSRLSRALKECRRRSKRKAQKEKECPDIQKIFLKAVWATGVRRAKKESEGGGEGRR